MSTGQKRMARARGGFTIIELLVVVIVIGILAAAGIAKYQDFADVARRRTCVSNASQLEKGISIYSTQTAPIPGDSTGLGYFLAQDTGMAANWAVAAGTSAAFVNTREISKVVGDQKLFWCPTMKSDMDKNNLTQPSCDGCYVGGCGGWNVNQFTTNYAFYYQGNAAPTIWRNQGAIWGGGNAQAEQRLFVWCGAFGGYSCPGPGRNVSNRHSSAW